MKRYWKMIVLIPFIFVSIGIYYAAASGSSNPDYYLKLLAGDEKKASHVFIQGMYQSDSISIGTRGSEYSSELPYLESLDTRRYYLEDFKQLAENHRSFMRGKSDLNAFYEDDQILAYAGTELGFDMDKGQSEIMTISLLDKGKQASSSFKVKMEKKSSDVINVLDVQIKDQTMKVLANSHHRDANGTNDIHLYTLDLDKKMIIGDQVVISPDAKDPNIEVSVGGINESDSTKPNAYAVFDIIQNRITERSGKSGVPEGRELASREVAFYDIWSSKLMPVQDSQIVDLLRKTDAENIVISHSGDEVYLIFLTDPIKPRVIQYSLTENKIKKDLTIALNDIRANSHGPHNLRIDNKRLYMMVDGKYDPNLVIAELDTGAIVYQGTIARKDNQDLRNLMFDHITIK